MNPCSEQNISNQQSHSQDLQDASEAPDSAASQRTKLTLQDGDSHKSTSSELYHQDTKINTMR